MALGVFWNHWTSHDKQRFDLLIGLTHSKYHETNNKSEISYNNGKSWCWSIGDEITIILDEKKRVKTDNEWALHATIESYHYLWITTLVCK